MSFKTGDRVVVAASIYPDSAPRGTTGTVTSTDNYYITVDLDAYKHPGDELEEWLFHRSELELLAEEEE